VSSLIDISIPLARPETPHMQAETQNPQNYTEAYTEAQSIGQMLSWGDWWEHFQDLPEPAEDQIFLRAA